ncbi:MAG: cyclodeaminase/cyclohydrolase family protein [Microbacterium arborescens]
MIPAATVEDFLAALARDQGDPGGGAAAAVVTAIAASLGQMVCRYSPDETAAVVAGRRLGDLRTRAMAAAQHDATASGGLGAALRPAEPGAEAERDRRIVVAATRAATTSALVGAVALAVWDQLRVVADVGDRHLSADVAVAAGAVAAGLGGAATNLRGGLTLLAAHGDAAEETARLAPLDARLRRSRDAARDLADRLGDG